jgi:subtilisin family serine protease
MPSTPESFSGRQRVGGRGRSRAPKALNAVAALGLSLMLLPAVAGAQGRDPGFDPALNAEGLPAAWGATTGAGGRVAVVDSGVAPIQDLSGRLQAGYDYANNDADPTDDNGHGTGVASILAAGTNGVGVEGVCPECLVIPVKAEDAAGRWTSAQLAAALDYAVSRKPWVINLSLGQDPYTAPLPSVNAAEAGAVAHGIVLVTSAGNSGSPDPNVKHMASDVPGLIVVGAVNPATNQLVASSNHGGWVHIGAYSPMSADLPDGSTTVISGTSVAAPQVAGAAALILKYVADHGLPHMGPTDVRRLLMETGTKVPGLDVACGCVLNVLAAVQKLGYGKPSVKVEVGLPGSGAGSVKSQPAGIACSGNANGRCQATFPAGASVTLAATPNPGSVFSGWRDVPGCSTSPTCTFAAAQDVSAAAVFTLKKFMVKVTKAGLGSVSSVPAGIACGKHCAFAFNFGVDVKLVAKAAKGYVAKWTGCTVRARACWLSKLKAAHVVKVSFAKPA